MNHSRISQMRRREIMSTFPKTCKTSMEPNSSMFVINLELVTNNLCERKHQDQ